MSSPMTPHWYTPGPNPSYARFARVPLRDEWFEAYQVAPHLFVFHEPRHYEETIANLVVGEERAALIDTGCGIGDLRGAVAQVTDKPILVINTHTHSDHIAGNGQFDDIAMFDHPMTRLVAAGGLSHERFQTDLLADGLVVEPWPAGFESSRAAVPPFEVGRWLHEGDRIDLGGRDLEVIYTPGEAIDHVCLLNRVDRVLFSGDILLHGPVWTHLEGGSLPDLIASYERLMGLVDDFDHLMPSHNTPLLDHTLLPDTLAGARQVMAGLAPFQVEIDPWKRTVRRYSFERFQLLTRHREGEKSRSNPS